MAGGRVGSGSRDYRVSLTASLTAPPHSSACATTRRACSWQEVMSGWTANTTKKMAETFKDIEDSEYCERGEDLVLDVCNTWWPSYTHIAMEQYVASYLCGNPRAKPSSPLFTLVFHDSEPWQKNWPLFNHYFNSMYVSLNISWTMLKHSWHSCALARASFRGLATYLAIYIRYTQ